MAHIDKPERGEAEHERERLAFLGWQCRLRQMAMRDRQGRPGEGEIAALWLGVGEAAPRCCGQVVTVINRLAEHSMVPELRHAMKRSHDPAERREAALRLFSATYYQRPERFSAVLTASFAHGSLGARQLLRAARCQLRFSACSQRVSISCRVWRLARSNSLWQSTFWHNQLFNPGAPGDLLILGFEPDWAQSRAEPPWG